MKNLSQREDFEFIEDIEEYELTQRIAYELANQNKEVIDIKILINKLIDVVRDKLLKHIIYKLPENVKKVDIFTAEKLYKKELEKYKESLELLHCFKNDVLLQKFKNFILEQEETIEIISLNKILLEQYWIREYYEEDICFYIFSDSNYVKERFEEFEREIGVNKQERFLTKFNKEIGNLENGDSFSIAPEDINDYEKRIDKIDKFVIVKNSTTYNNKINFENLKLISYAQQLIIPNDLNPCFKININPYLIDETILKFKIIIEKLKNDKHVVHTCKELIDREFEKYKYPNKYNKNKRKRCTIQQIWADWFFIYNYFSKYKQNNYLVANEKIYENLNDLLSEYYDDGSTGYDNNWNDESTYRKIISTMNELIINLKYKTMITFYKTDI